MQRKIFTAVVLYALVLILSAVLFVGSRFIRKSHYYESIVIIQLNHVEYKPEPRTVEPLTIPSAETHSKFQQPPVSPEIERDEVRKGYDEFAWHPDRLGCGIGKEFRTIPVPWQMKWNTTRAGLLPTNATLKKRKKRILLYDSFEWWHFNKKLECPLIPTLECEMVDKPKNLQESEDYDETLPPDLDALIIVRDFAHTNDVQSVVNNATNLIAIYFTLESPLAENFDIPLNPWRVYFASYWRGSDIYAPYFRWTYYDLNVTTKAPSKNYAAGRTKMAAIVVSNCRSFNDRLNFVSNLQKYIEVDIYGKCATSRDTKCGNDCFDLLRKKYKFYLAFENSNCRDYITEKFYSNALKHDMVPVVLGAHPEDYRAVAPAHSYIHVEDFASVKALADYLILLDTNDTLYNEYFAWKGTGSFAPISFLCEACAFVHAKSDEAFNYFEPEETRSYLNSEDVYEDSKLDWTWTNNMLCLSPDQWYWNPPANRGP